MDLTSQPVSNVVWVDRFDLKPNDYNPNHQAPPEHGLLKTSILLDGWTQPIVVHRPTMTIVDGEHRWRASEAPEVQAMTGGLVPVVYIDRPGDHLMMSTIRHNRARGTHGVLPMAEIVRDLVGTHGVSPADVMALLGMEDEEVRRLLDRAGQPARVAAKTPEFGKAWVPERK